MEQILFCEVFRGGSEGGKIKRNGPGEVRDPFCAAGQEGEQ